ncbi:hypothetical protein [Amycolatopsis australiensis]|uniref:hypothetical protein n=1 Tax=Amycolatopsis australiensis TaxID=546364 RepID=UPI001161042F|nr:hypothetical protein [Amycolatopsis australiensis]
MNELRQCAALLLATGIAASLLTGCGATPGADSAIVRRNCDSSLRPESVALRATPPRPDLCFGGGIGAMIIPGTMVTVFESGDYTACVGREAWSTCLDPRAPRHPQHDDHQRRDLPCRGLVRMPGPAALGSGKRCALGGRSGPVKLRWTVSPPP